jgi:hypothetical protein
MIANALLRILRAIEARRLRVVIVMHVDSARLVHADLTRPAMATTTALAERHRGARDAVAEAMAANDL